MQIKKGLRAVKVVRFRNVYYKVGPVLKEYGVKSNGAVFLFQITDQSQNQPKLFHGLGGGLVKKWSFSDYLSTTSQGRKVKMRMEKSLNENCKTVIFKHRP